MRSRAVTTPNESAMMGLFGTPEAREAKNLQ